MNLPYKKILNFYISCDIADVADLSGKLLKCFVESHEQMTIYFIH